MAGRTQISEIEPQDLEALARFYREQTGGVTAERGDPVEHLRWFLFANPATAEDIPKGWIVRDGEGRVIGAKCCAPQDFQHGGATYRLAHGGGYYVDSRHRGIGLVLMRRFLSLSDRFAQFAATMNEVSGALYESYGGYSIPRTDAELLGPLRWGPLLEEVVARRTGSGALGRAVAPAGMLRPSSLRGRPRGTLRRVEDPASVGDLPVKAPAEHAHQLTALRDPAFLRWRYFDGPDATRAFYLYEGSAGTCWVAVNRRRRGGRGQIRALMVLDLWGSLPPEETPDVARALAERHRDEVDVLVFRGMPEARERALCASGFLRRDLPRAVGVCIDPAGHLPTRDWYLVPADGDMGH